MTVHIVIISKFPLIKINGIQCGIKERNQAGKGETSCLLVLHAS